jgi:hypothetical protein
LAAIGRVYVFISGLPANAAVTARFGRLDALQETPRPIQNPTLTVNGQQCTFPVTVAPAGYLEFHGTGTARVFDANGFTKADVPPGGEVPVLQKGPQYDSFWPRPQHLSRGERPNHDSRPRRSAALSAWLLPATVASAGARSVPRNQPSGRGAETPDGPASDYHIA